MSGVALVTVEAGEADARLDRWFRRRYPQVTQGQLQKLLRTGQVRVDGARAKADQRLSAGQAVRVPPLGETAERPERPDVRPDDAELIRSLVIYDKGGVVALNKPSGLAVQGGAKTRRHIDGMLPALSHKGEVPRLAHRLDRDTSGVLLLGRTPVVTAKIARAFQAHRARKTYWAVTLGAPHPREGDISGFMRKQAGEGRGEDRELMRSARHGEEGAQHARTLYSVVASAGQRAAWVALRPLTGRTHQLRFHMAGLGYAILGDHKYTCDRETPGGLEDRLHLHAWSIELPGGPDFAPVSVSAPTPPHFRSTFDAFGFDARTYENPFEEP